tara:strand:+ start:2774 stop:3757 length:984 start_codon:yes stop_codon:yes gene_type:complete
MILKFFELKNKKLDNFNYFLLYGNNSGLIEEVINNHLKPIKTSNIFNYDEDEIIKNPENFEENVFNNSFFENEKLIIISRASDKILKIVEKVVEKKIEDLTIIIKSNILEKKSKLRTFFEKQSNTICIPFYEDNNQVLISIVQKFLLEKNIKMSSQNINVIVERSNGNRINLYNELDKISSFSKNKKIIDTNDILKLTNLSENFSVYELVDNSLARKQKKILNILNENNFSSEDCILILRIFLIKLKRLLKIQQEVQKEKNVEKVISSYKPPIFWKEKDVIKEQIKQLNLKKINDLIVRVNEIELLIKKYPSTALNITTDFILDQTQ